MLDPFRMAIGAVNLVLVARPAVFNGLRAWRLGNGIFVFRHAVQILHLLVGPELTMPTTIRAMSNRVRNLAKSHFELFLASILLAALGGIAIRVGFQRDCPDHGTPSFPGYETDRVKVFPFGMAWFSWVFAVVNRLPSNRKSLAINDTM